ncbi:DMT family transporter [Sulfitobacter donghicola]|uniref:Membrane protein n=1 Tax=Sulfitobacter donghicola DSW-25 = KCTC 12864 = JCM 14565 TaxID=1300350 RepID=A0A073IDZ1_9RHOB|nr:DMT family transporter [Sulfitobacter donghicola]KEJ87795.1 membrane protein [Sulfitobacter donghicola DSW-25 = KCTC 12864 = JCM 14565]KIN68347.1 Integral membrane protein [Sulfitobacter donghicola DSW-25 = KCTC 12864 = JCM 14565]
MSANAKGALLMMASMAAFVINDTFLKLTNGAIPLFQLIFVRGVLATILIYFLARSLGALRSGIGPRDKGLIALRGVAEIVTSYFFLSALFKMPLGNLNAIMQVVPLTVTLGSALFYREAVGWRRMLAIAVGFCGVLLIIRPGAEGFNIWSLYALGAVICVTLRDLLTRQLSADVSGMAVTLGTTVSVMIAAGLASLTQEWVPVTGQQSVYIVGSAVFILAGYFFSIQVMRAGDVSFIAPFRYTGLIGAMIIGYFVFDEVPTALTLLGAAIVTGMGLFTFYRERKLSRA